MSSCKIKNCTSKSKLFFRLPAESNARNRWIEAIEEHQKFDDSVGVYFVCINHFAKKEVRRGEKTILVHESVPSIFPKIQKVNQSLPIKIPNVTKSSPIKIENVMSLPIKRKANVLNVTIKQENFEGEPEKYLATNLTAPSRQQVKLVDIEKLKSASVLNEMATTSKNPVEKKSTGTPTKMCVNCVQLDVKLQEANSTIRSMKRKISELTAELKRFTHSVYMKSLDKCKICAGYMKKEEIDQHICTKQETIKCKYCPETFKSIQKLVDHLKMPDHVDLIKEGTGTYYRCQICPIGYPMIELLQCHKKSHNIIRPEPTIAQPKQGEKAQTTVEETILSSERSTIKFFKCAKCDMCFDVPGDLLSHNRQYSCDVDFESGKFQCFVCNKMFDKIALLQKHMNTVHDRSKACEICSKKLDTDELSTHICGNETTIQCEYCHKNFTSTIDLLKHLDSSDEKKKMYRCDVCLEFFPMMILKHQHMTQHTETSKSFMCHMCSETFVTSTLLSNHERSHRRREVQKKVNNEPKKEYLCDECGKSFSSSSNLSLHRYTHSEPQFKCTQCPRQFTRLSRFNIHLEKHKHLVYICELCQVELRTKHGYEKHMKRHKRTEADRRYECSICSRKFFDRKHLNSHKLVHTSERPFKCKHCHVAYKYSGDLHKHLRTHTTDGKIHQCTKCADRFYYYEELSDHLLYHYKKEKEQNNS
ncbi:zinc finger protein 184-like isoform X2 [Contarinia nasturtii]|uniref:zinc finger protein 184-like isoform X2 n=1 Tax=Contarinia nasturtii TaxID=265458 RepID=UPI0012D451E7|nr:zinc finger protein 184-like isoform X2 [Contarinia nasturtii]